MTSKIKVEIELSPERVHELIATGAKGKRITNDELESLAKSGAIRAADYLSEAQLTAVGLAIPSWIKKAGEKAVVSASSRAAEEVVLEAVGEILIAERGPEFGPKE